MSMAEILTFLASLPTWLIALPIAPLVAFVIIGFAQGREIQFWPPRIGPRPHKQEPPSTSIPNRVASMPRPLLASTSNRAALTAIPSRPDVSLTDELKDARRVWMTMHSGTLQSIDLDILRATSTREVRILVTSPASRALDEVAKISGRSRELLAGDIEAFAGKLLDAGAQVRYFDGPIGNSSIIVNRGDSDAWARIEVLIPFAPPKQRPSVLANQADGSDFVEQVATSFLSLWDHKVFTIAAMKKSG